VPSLYFVQGLQFFVVMLIAGLMFKNMGVANDEIARWTGLLGLAWAFKPLWSPFLELARSKKRLVVASSSAARLAGAAGRRAAAAALLRRQHRRALPAGLQLGHARHRLRRAVHGRADETRQAAYAGWQGAFFNASKFLTLGGLLVLAGHLERRFGACTTPGR
jgi:PAT family beta-lactamase induction signal transducer AmpG